MFDTDAFKSAGLRNRPGQQDDTEENEPVFFHDPLQRRADYASKNNLKQVDNMFQKMSNIRQRSMRSFEKAYNVTQSSA